MEKVKSHTEINGKPSIDFDVQSSLKQEVISSGIHGALIQVYTTKILNAFIYLFIYFADSTTRETTKRSGNGETSFRKCSGISVFFFEFFKQWLCN